MWQAQVIAVLDDDESREPKVNLSGRVMVRMWVIPKRRSGLIDRERRPPS
jgi:hypothetical protein